MGKSVQGYPPLRAENHCVRFDSTGVIGVKEVQSRELVGWEWIEHECGMDLLGRNRLG